MKKLMAVLVMALGAAAFAQGNDQGSAAKQDQMKQGQMKHDHAAMQGKSAQGMQHEQMMSGYVPPRVTKEDRKGLDAMWKTFGEGYMKHDMNAAASVIDFPVLMVTDDGQGNVTTAVWDRDTWIDKMGKAMQGMPMPKKGHAMPMPKHHYEFLANDIAVTTSTETMHMGKHTMTMKSSGVAILKNGKWMLKSMVEGGWGKVMGEQTSK